MSEPLDFNQLLGSVQKMQEQLEAAASVVVEGHSGGGAVKVTVSGDLSFQSVSIDPAVVDPTDVEMLEDLVLAALHDATAKVEESRRSAIGDLGLEGGPGGLLG